MLKTEPIDKGICGHCGQVVAKVQMTAPGRAVHFRIVNRWIHVDRGPYHHVPSVFFADGIRMVGERVRFYGGTVDYVVVKQRVRYWRAMDRLTQYVDLQQVDGKRRGITRRDVLSTNVNPVQSVSR